MPERKFLGSKQKIVVFVLLLSCLAAIVSERCSRVSPPSVAVRPVEEARPAVPTAEAETRLSEAQQNTLRLARECHRQATHLATRGHYSEAIEPANRAVELQRLLLGEEHIEYAASLNNLAALYCYSGDYVRAEPLHRRAAEIRQRLVGAKDPRYAQSLENLAAVYWAMGQHARAHALCRQAVDIYRHSVNRPAINATSVSNLAVIENSMGNWSEAERLYQEAIQHYRESFTDKTLDCANVQINLSGLCIEMGDYARAEPLCREGAEIIKQVLGETHVDYASALKKLADFHQLAGDFAQAAELEEKAADIRLQQLGRTHPDYASSLHDLGVIYREMAVHHKTADERRHELGDRAEVHYREAMEIRRKALGESHPAYADTLVMLAMLHGSRGEYGAAEALLRQALQIRSDALGREHPDWADCLFRLAWTIAHEQRAEEAYPLAMDALRATRRFMERTAAVLSERQHLALLNRMRIHFDVPLSVTVDADAARLDDIYTEVLAWKGVVTGRQQSLRALRNSSASGHDNAASARLYEELTLATAKLSTETAKQHDMPAATRLSQLAENVDRLQQELSRASPDYQRQIRERQVTPKDVAAALPDDAALVDLLEYTRYTPAVPGTPGYHARHVAAFIVRRDRPLARIELGLADTVEREVAAWREQLGATRSRDTVGIACVRKIWNELEKQTPTVRIVMVSPDGALNRLPWAALPGKQPAEFLIEHHSIVVLPIPRQLPALLAATVAIRGPSLLLVGDVDFGGDPGAFLLADNRAALRGASQRNFGPLPGTREEYLTIERQFRRQFGGGRSEVLEHGQPTESAPRERAGRYRWLHLATHGFFAEPRAVLAPAAPRAAPPIDSAGPGIYGLQPGLLSGLVLAGANQPMTVGHDDGILTATEVENLDLEAVELATLSACETGLGKTAGGEGVLGLQRAFQIAGARATLTSLWKVDDDATRVLMNEFYRNLWEKKLPKLEALRRAQVTMLRSYDPGEHKLRGADDFIPIAPRRLAEDRKNGGHPRCPPFYWAGWVLSGDWR